MQIRYFHCPVCHVQVMAPKETNFKRNSYNGKKHRKNMYCVICKKEQNFIQDEAFHIKNSIF